MTTLVTVLTEGFADWETALLNGAGRSFYGATAHYAAPKGLAVTSMGGLRATPDLALEDLDPADFDVLVVCGGTSWQGPDAPDISSIVHRTHEAGKLVAGICDGTIALARTGLLDATDHTSNGVGYLDPTGYKGKPHYRDVPYAITADNVVTAPASAPVSFMGAVMRGLGLADEQLDYYLGLHAAQFDKPDELGQRL
ncbi:MAG TPA: DJ-1/PfpI family protein [Devosiaceae bacterium]|jgi:putative intracellular protease/amidase